MAKLTYKQFGLLVSGLDRLVDFENGENNSRELYTALIALGLPGQYNNQKALSDAIEQARTHLTSTHNELAKSVPKFQDSVNIGNHPLYYYRQLETWVIEHGYGDKTIEVSPIQSKVQSSSQGRA